jgi:Na+-driven multidrug efflux pump
VSYYHGAGEEERKRQMIRIAVWTALGAGIGLLLLAQAIARPIVGIFGDFPESVTGYAVGGLRIFVMAYVFMGINFVMMTYYQSIGNVRMAAWITMAREMILMLAFILILPRLMGITGVWLAVPLAECMVFLSIVLYYKKQANADRPVTYEA